MLFRCFLTENLSDKTEDPYNSNQAPIKQTLRPSQHNMYKWLIHLNINKFNSNEEYLPMSPASTEEVVYPKAIFRVEISLLPTKDM